MSEVLNRRARPPSVRSRVADCERGDTIRTFHGAIYLSRRTRGGWLASLVNPVTLQSDGGPEFWVSPVTPVMQVIETAAAREKRAGREWERR